MRVLLHLLVMVVLSACGGGPDESVLRKDVAERVAQALPAGTVTVATLERRGSQADTKAPSGETRRVVYFDTELKLERDFDFGAWDSPGVAGVVSALGTGPKGIVGITSGGNKAGDRVLAHGTVLYKREGDRWAPTVSGGFAPTDAPAYATAAPQGGAIGIIDQMRTVVQSVPKDISPSARVLIEEELVAANAAIRAAVARASQGYAIAAGPEHGQYFRFAQALADPKGLRIVPLVTRGGEENLRMLRDGKVQLALSQGDAALAAYEGKGSFAEDGAQTTLRAIGSLYPEPVHVIVRGDSPILSMSALAGRRVAIGQVGSASRTTALRVLEAHGIGPKNVQMLELPLNEALIGLRQKQVDAVIQVIGVPADSIRDALTNVPLRLVPLSERGVAILVASNSGYLAHTIPRGAYATQKEDVRTIATAALLLVSSDLAESEVGAITRYVFGPARDFASRGSAQGTQVSAANARLGLPIPLHIAAAKALEGLSQPTAPPPASPAKK
ncbi:MAG TPA: TAXI family TRAP transporter solute-binding subunit [Burkholderiaceae bacterium]|nr:TAXI family TRAP transporter solute-binding subunit [Burkholderiaceae bacterium]